MPNFLQSQTRYFPTRPGCYLFKDKLGVVLYVGKAKNLKSRVRQYFGQDKRPQLPFLIDEARSVEYLVANTELESLYLENNLIKKYQPKYNIKLKDDKNYAFIAINSSTEIPQIGYVRKVSDSASQDFTNPSASWGSGSSSKFQNTNNQSHPQLKTKKIQLKVKDQRLRIKDAFFGPYSSTKKIKETLDLVRFIFPYCSNTQVTNQPLSYQRQGQNEPRDLSLDLGAAYISIL
jgi:excinuclease UvrABC nuclease subunit